MDPGPGAWDVRGTWGVQVLEQGMRGVEGWTYAVVVPCLQSLFQTIGPGARDVRGTWGI